jgi:hypothetical protein
VLKAAIVVVLLGVAVGCGAQTVSPKDAARMFYEASLEIDASLIELDTSALGRRTDRCERLLDDVPESQRTYVAVAWAFVVVDEWVRLIQPKYHAFADRVRKIRTSDSELRRIAEYVDETDARLQSRTIPRRDPCAYLEGWRAANWRDSFQREWASTHPAPRAPDVQPTVPSVPLHCKIDTLAPRTLQRLGLTLREAKAFTRRAQVWCIRDE